MPRIVRCERCKQPFIALEDDDTLCLQCLTDEIEEDLDDEDE